MRTNNARLLRDLWKYFFLALFAFICIFPFYWIIAGATNPTVDIMRGKITFGSYLSTNYENLCREYIVWRSSLNSLVVTFLVLALSLLICTPAGYAFAKYRFKGRKTLFTVFLLSMMIPFSALMIPLFRLTARYKLINTYAGIVLPSISPVFLLFFLRQSFSGYPTEIIEAARIDGCGEVPILLRVVIPSMKSTMAAATIWSFMTNWNNYLWPLLVIQNAEMRTLPITLATIGAGGRYIDYGAMMVAIIIATVPIVVIYFTMQKQFVTGIMGATKG